MSLDTSITLIVTVLFVVCGTVHFFESRGGWTLYWAEKRRDRK